MTDPTNAVHLSLAAWEAGMAASFTIMARWPILLQTLQAPNRASIAETRLMVDEKIIALVEGTVAAQMSALSFAAKLARGEIHHAGHIARAATETITAAFTPARRCVVANAKRLSGANCVVG